jgi:hydrogenase assembly chaperone HypC/HupF
MCMNYPARILQISVDRSQAIVWSRGARRHISLGVLALEGRDVDVGDWVVTSAGLAVERLGEREARELLAIVENTNDHEGVQG